MKSNRENAPGTNTLDGKDHADLSSPVSRKRWEEAQEWELAFWNRQNIPPPWWKRLLRPFLVLAGLRPPLSRQEHDDRNHWWMNQFRGYRDIPAELDNVCELGCGPYTNLRLLRAGRRIAYACCSDPLARHYIQYPDSWLAEAHRAGILSVDFHAIEECPFRSDQFDCTILVNVLDHVMDARKCLDEALRITKPEGFLIFGQDLTSAAEKRPENPGHPFLLTHEQIEPVLDAACDEVLRHIIPREELSEPEMHYGALAYIGRKRANARAG